MLKNNFYRIYIKLGSDCNLHCKYCHAEHKEIIFNPAILPIIQQLGVKEVTFGGGEPLLYWNTIKEIVAYLGNSIHYRMVTNGTLFTEEIVNFINQYNFFVGISLDGIHSVRDISKPIPWDLIKQLKLSGAVVTFYKENQNIRETLTSLNILKKQYLSIVPTIWSSFPNFVHSTSKTGILSDKALADSYIQQMTALFEEALQIYKQKSVIVPFLKRSFEEFVKVKINKGVFCCNDAKLLLLADGTICICPYTYEIVGDIFHLDELNWDKIRNTYSRPQCKSCNLFTVCGNRCCQDITDNQCYIMRQMNSNLMSLMEQYNVSYEELLNGIKKRFK